MTEALNYKLLIMMDKLNLARRGPEVYIYRFNKSTQAYNLFCKRPQDDFETLVWGTKDVDKYYLFCTGYIAALEELSHHDNPLETETNSVPGGTTC